MNRFHVHVAVDGLEANIRFYSALFGAEPGVRKDGYAKWIVEDPRVNFAISKRGQRPGVNHLGIQVDADAALDAMRMRLADAAIRATTPNETACCYARSNKYWTTDPQGIAWETFHTLASIPVFGQGDTVVSAKHTVSGCCVPAETPETKEQSGSAPASAACCSC